MDWGRTVPAQVEVDELLVEVAIERSSILGHWDVTFTGDAVPGALAAFAGVLALNRLDITSAIVRKPGDGKVYDTFDVSPLGDAGFGPHSAPRLAEQAIDALAGRRDLGVELGLVRGSRPETEAPALVEVSADSDISTGVVVRTADRLGLLHDIAATLTRHGMRTRSLTALTYGGRAHDTFRIVDASGVPPKDPVSLEALRVALIGVCAG